MDPRLLVAAALGAALTLTPVPAGAQRVSGGGIPEAKTSHFVGSTSSPDLGTCDDDGDGRGDRHHVSHGDGWAYADGTWALYNNRSWEPNSYNDWWHDRPDRAYPRWVQEQHMRGTCTPDRMWWSGSGWHC